jgi:hypothetical protein
MKRRLWGYLFTGFAATSLLFALATGAAWIRSYFIADSLTWHDGAFRPALYMNEYGIVCSGGGLQVYHQYYKFGIGGLAGGWDAGHYFRHDRDYPNAFFLPSGYPYGPLARGERLSA